MSAPPGAAPRQLARTSADPFHNRQATLCHWTRSPRFSRAKRFKIVAAGQWCHPCNTALPHYAPLHPPDLQRSLSLMAGNERHKLQRPVCRGEGERDLGWGVLSTDAGMRAQIDRLASPPSANPSQKFQPPLYLPRRKPTPECTWHLFFLARCFLWHERYCSSSGLRRRPIRRCVRWLSVEAGDFPTRKPDRAFRVRQGGMA